MSNSCRIVKVGAVTAVFNEDGTRNELFQQALEYYNGNVEQAMDVWNIFNSEEFESTGLKTPTVEQVLSFASNFPQTFEETKTLSGREVVEVVEMAENNGFSSLNEFRDKLNSIFKPKGFFEMNTKEAVKAGLYTVEEVEAINPNTLFNALNRLDKHIDAYGDIEIVNPKYSGVKNTSRPKNMFGSYPSVTETEVVQYVLDNGADALVDSEYSFVSQNISDGILGATRAKNQENAKPKFTLTPQDTLDRLNKTGLANKVHILSPKEMDDKLVELGVDAKLAKQVIGRKGAKELDDYSMGVINRIGDLTIAEKMERSGKSPTEIKLATGWERGGEFISIFKNRTDEEVINYLGSLGISNPNLQEIKNNELTFQKQNGVYNGKWRYEISDGKLKNLAEFNFTRSSEGLKADVVTTRLKDVLINEDLYRAYPELESTPITFYKPTKESNYSEMFGFVLNDNIYINYDKGFGLHSRDKGRTELGGYKRIHSVLSHELQHIIQRREEFEGGASLGATKPRVLSVIQKVERNDRLTEEEKEIKKIIDSLYPNKALTNEEIDKVALKVYGRSVGEVEARNVERRISNKEGLLRSTEDIVREKQLNIIQFQQPLLSITPNGFVYNGEVFLSEEKINDLSLLVHEFNHLYTNLLKQTNRPLYERGLKLVEQEGQEYIDFVKQNQPNLEGEALLEEALTQAVGEQGARIIDETRRNKFVQFLADVWASIKGQLGLSAYSNSQVQKMNLKEYVNAMAVDLLSGERLGQSTDNNIQYSFYNDSDFDSIGQVKPSVLEEIEAERNAIKEQAIKDGSFMKAPNGKDTNLKEDQWIDVRTKRFKDWYGDWENNPENASKVVDESGEPLVLYHGTSSRFTIFGDEVGASQGTYLKDREGFFFAKEDVAINYGNGVLVPSFLNIKEPRVENVLYNLSQLEYNYTSEREEAEDAGYPISRWLGEGEESFEANDSATAYFDDNVETIMEDVDSGSNDGVIVEGADKSVTVVAFNPNQIKSATSNTGTYSNRNNDIRFQIIGEQGAINLDKAQESTRLLDNLAIARQMEGEKTPQEIRLATGWEKGNDGNWKYEIQDGVLKKDIEFESMGSIEGLSDEVMDVVLKDIYDNEELYNTYPELAETEVFIYKPKDGTIMADVEASEIQGKIFLNYEKVFDKLQRDRLEGAKRKHQTIAHELQHIIQRREGFAKGGNTLTTKRLLKETQRKISAKEALNTTEQKVKEISDILNLLMYGEDISTIEESIAKEIYRRLGGEVEARNVESRLDMIPEQRRETLLQETEDVAREDQITILDGFEGDYNAKQSDDIVSYSTIPNGRGISHTFNLGGENIASIRTLPIENGEIIEGAIVKEDYQGQGIGTELYLETIRNLMIDKKVLRSDKAQTTYAKRIWDGLVNLGVAVKISDSQYESIPAPFNVTPTTSIDTVIDFLSQPSTEMYVFEDVTKDVPNRAESDKFGINIEDEANSYRQIPTLMLDGEVFTTENIYPYIELKNTIIPSNNPTFNVDANLLLNLDEDVWLSRRKEVKSVLKGIEKTLISNNIDVIGISELETSREVVSEFLVAIQNVLSLPNDTNLRTLANLKSEYINSDMKVFTKDLPSKYDNLTVVSVESNLSQDELFEMEGLIKIHTDNMYQKVEVLPIDELYDEMYSRFLKGEVNIPQNFFPKDMDLHDIANEEQVREGIQNYIRSRNVGFDSINQEAISAYQVLFNHDPIPQRLPNIESLKTNAEYLKTGFVTDFYNFILQEKFNNTDLYNSTLKYFKVTDSDLSFHGIDLSIKGMKYEQELRDYAQVKKDSGKLGELLANTEVEFNEDLEVLNNPNSVTNTPNYTQIDKGLYVTNQSPENYIRVDSGVARMVGQMFEDTIYQDVNIIKGSNIYYDTNLNFDVNTDVISKKYLVWKQANNVGLQQVNVEQILDNIKTPNNITENTLQQASDFGITIVPTSKAVREKYDECGV